ncbi:M48 family metallopeptidase [Nonomuraea sp. NPDC050310]|uniref:M48 family metallopeptidase n=1 Tax=Nonomuraea sp. NPDC050310 TaxID=3154935 RepID=UPI003403A6E8
MRAAVSLALLAGFLLVAVAMLGGAVALAMWLASATTGIIAVKLTWPIGLAVVGGVGGALWQALRTRPSRPEGLPVGPEQAPELWQTVRELAAAVGTRPPDRIHLIPDANAAVTEDTRLFGLVGGERHLYVGLPLLHTFTVAQLRAVLAHELGHYSNSHTRLGAVAYRGRLAIGGTLARIGPYNVAGWVFKGYARLYLLADNAVSRRQEFQADEASVRLAGPQAARSALLEIPVLDAAWSFFQHAYLTLGWQHGYAPDDLFAGFAAFVKARESELAELRAAPPEEEDGSLWDTHPPMPVRIAALAALPEPQVEVDERPATRLLPDLAGAGRALQAQVLDLDGRTVLPWPQFTAAALAADLQDDADTIFRSIRRVTGAERLSLADVLDLIEAGRLAEIAQPLFPTATRREVGGRFAEPLETLLLLAAVRSRVTGWEHSWSGPAVLKPDVREILAKVAEAAVGDGLADARAWLAENGIDPAAATMVAGRAGALGSAIVAGLANFKIDGAEYDVVALSSGLVLIPDPGKSDKGTRRLQALVAASEAEELAAAHRFLPYEEIAQATVEREVPVKATLRLHDGQVLAVQERMASEFLAKDSRDVFLGILRGIG